METPKKEELCLDKLINVCLKKLESATPGTEEYKFIEDDLANLYKLRTEEKRIDNSHAIELAKMQAENELNIKKLDAEKQYKAEENERENKKLAAEKLKTEISAGVSVTAMSILVYLSLRTMRFEETGVIRSKAMPKLGDIVKFIKIF